MNIYIWCTIFLVIGIAVGISIEISVINHEIKHGKMFFKDRDGLWVGEWNIITKELNALILKENAKK
jgi:hypothetical protein